MASSHEHLIVLSASQLDTLLELVAQFGDYIDDNESLIAALCSTADDYLDAVEALEDMVTQHLYTADGVVYDHGCLGSNEYAASLLTRLRPERWEKTNRGMRRRS